MNGTCNHACCMSGYCGWHRGGHSWLLRLILGLIILAIVFKIGFELGEFKAEFLGGDGYNSYRMMDRNMMGGSNMMGGMMGGAAYDSLDNLNDLGF